jgi:putative ABC transport system permease protein
MIDAFLHDVRSALRHVKRAPAFGLAAVVTLGLSIGATTAVYSVLHALTLRQLPVRAPSELIMARSVGPQGQSRLTLITAIDLLRQPGSVVQDYCGYNGGLVVSVMVNGAPSQAWVDFMSPGCLEMLGVTPMLGRTFTAEEARLSSASARVALIGHRFWQRVFGADPNVVRRTIRTEGVEVRILGVLPESYGGLQVDGSVDIVAPFGGIMPPPVGRVPGASLIIGRLKPGGTLDGARAELEARWPSIIDAVVPGTLPPRDQAVFRDVRVRVESGATGKSFLSEQYGRPLLITVGMTSVLLLLACLNLGGLLLARLAARSNELAVRRALGATRRRLIQQVLVDSLVLATLGALLAIPVAWGWVGAIDALLPVGLVARTVQLTPDAQVLVRLGIVALAAGVVMGLVPLTMLRPAGNGVGMQPTRTVAHVMTRRGKALLVAQIAVSVVLVFGAGLMARTVHELRTAPSGVHPEHVLSVRLMPVPNGYERFDPAAYYPALLQRIASIPGVRAAGYARLFPHQIVQSSQLEPIIRLGEDERSAGGTVEVASPEFFDTVGIRLRRGRLLTWNDRRDTAQVAVVNERLAALLAPDGEIVGTRIKFTTDPARQDVEIVGVVTNATLGNPRNMRPIVYRPAMQEPRLGLFPTLQIATHGDPLEVAEEVTAAIQALGREYAQSAVRLEDALARGLVSERLTSLAAEGTAVLSLMMALVGVYSILAYAVARRTREIGIRVALGGSSRAMLRMVLGEGLRVVVLGVVVGLPCAIAATRVVRGLLYGVTEFDPWTLGSVAALFVSVGIVAGLRPALRAARVDPVIALRSE